MIWYGACFGKHLCTRCLALPYRIYSLPVFFPLLYLNLSCAREPTTKRYLCMKILPNVHSMHSLIPRYLTPGTHLLLKLFVNRTSVPHKHENTFILESQHEY